MQSTVTLELYEYNDLYLKAIQHDDLKEENEKLKEDLVIAHKQLEELQQPKDDAPVREVGMGNMKIAESMEEFKKKLRAEYPNSIMLCDKDNPEKKVVINNKGICLYEGDILTATTK